jgi:TrkA domain protein
MGGVPDIRVTLLPGVGVRHEFATGRGERVVVLTHRSGRRELAIYSRDDPDTCIAVLHLEPEDSRTLAELLGASQVSEALIAVQQQVEGLAIDWLPVAASSRFAGATIGGGQFRAQTGAYIVALLRNDTTIPAPGPDASLEAGDVVVAIGKPDGLTRLRNLLEP